MGSKFDINSINRSVDVAKIKKASTNVYLNKFTEKSGGLISVIPLDKIDDFPNHPFRVIDDKDMEDLTESIKLNGVLTPIIVRHKSEGRFECIAGHRRRRASTKANKLDIPAYIVDMNDDEATVAMVDANLQREKILPSEKAFAYKMKLDAISRQGKRTDLTSCQVGTKLRADEQIADELGESARQIQRFIRLTNLVPELLQASDEKKLSLIAAVDLSYLDVNEQYTVCEYMKQGKAPSIRQAAELKALSKARIFNKESAERVMFPPKKEEQKKEKESTKIEIENWGGTDNQVMKGYILHAFNKWNEEYPEQSISKEALENLMMGLRWATENMTAEEAYNYYLSH